MNTASPLAEATSQPGEEKTGPSGALQRLNPALLRRAGYVASQTARVGWYAAHYAALLRMTPEVTTPGAPPHRAAAAPPDPVRTRQAFFRLFEQDLANIEAGLYPAPRDVSVSPRKLMGLLRDSRRFFADAPDVARRRQEEARVEVRDSADVDRDAYPPYFLQNFHYQTDGWLSRESARLYDTQVEVLFTGAADAMRRRALAEVARAFQGRDQRGLSLLDVACGTGRFLEQTLDAFPRLQVTGLDLSPAYVEEARGRLKRWRNARIVEANAEAILLESASFDAVSCIYLFHELPPKVRPRVAAEMARVVKPGGVVVLADSIQAGDDPNLDLMLEQFPRLFHEPYYAHYSRDDLDVPFTNAGLHLDTETQGFLTKVKVFRRPEAS